MTMTKKGITKAQPEAQPQVQPEIVRHPNWPFRKVEMKNPYDTPPEQRFIHNCRSKRPPVVRQALSDADWSASEKVDKSN
jgi:hypothetical protein